MAVSNGRKKNRQEIEASLKSAVLDLTPNVLERIDLSTPQNKEEGSRTVFAIRRRMIGVLAAACFSMIALAGGTYTYQNGKVDSLIGIDVNPSIELSVNRKNRILAAEALNEDAVSILKDMDLKGVNLNVAINAVIGSMATHGYLDDLDNAILVTVSNDSIKKASNLRTSVVSDIQKTLEEKQLNAVVYDQQVVEEDEVKQLADKFKISYGKAYFLKELISQNSTLTMADMEELAPLTMEEIAKVIAHRSYSVSGKTDVTKETPVTHTTGLENTKEEIPKETDSTEVTVAVEETLAPTLPTEKESQIPPKTTQAQTQITNPPTTAAPEETTADSVVVTSENIKIDYVDYENGLVMVHFKTKVKWKNPTVSVKDEDGNTYSAKVGDTDTDYCEIHVAGLQGATEYTFILGGISPKVGRQTTVKGVFETPVIGTGNADSDGTEEGSEEIKQVNPAEESSSETEQTVSETEKTASQEETQTTKSQEEPSETGRSS